MLAYPSVEMEQARQMDVWDLMKCLATKQPQWPPAVVKGDRRADMAGEGEKAIDRSHMIVTYHERLCELLPGNEWMKPSLLR